MARCGPFLEADLLSVLEPALHPLAGSFKKTGTIPAGQGSTSMQPLVSCRMMSLLRGLNTHGFVPIPLGVGRKSVNIAMFNGWIQVEDRSLKPRCKLTPAGDAYRREYDRHRSQNAS